MHQSTDLHPNFISNRHAKFEFNMINNFCAKRETDKHAKFSCSHRTERRWFYMLEVTLIPGPYLLTVNEDFTVVNHAHVYLSGDLVLS